MDRFQFLTLLAIVVGGLTQSLKTERFQGAFQFVFKRPLPKKALPWIALTFGVAGTLTEAGLRGETFTLTLVASVMLQGLFAGGFAVAGAETVAKLKPEVRDGAALTLLIIASLGYAACGPAQHPCVDAYDKARTEAEIKEVDAVCGHLLLEGGGGEGGGK